MKKTIFSFFIAFLLFLPNAFADRIDVTGGGGGAGATAWDDISDPDAASEIDFADYITELKLGASGDFRIGDGGSDYVKFGPDGAMSFVGNATISLHTDALDTLTEIAAALKSGADATLITGTKGTDTYAAVWNADGDLVGGSAAPQPLDADLTTLSGPTAWRIFYSNSTSVITELVLGANGTFLESNGASAAPAFRALLATDIPDISATYEVQLDNEAGLYAVLSDVTEFAETDENLNITKADPEARLTDSGDSEYTRVIRSDTSGKATRYNRVYEAGGPGTALIFDGSNEYVGMGNIINIDTNLTISTWVELVAADGEAMLVSRGDATDQYGIQVLADEKIRFYASEGTEGDYVDTNTALTPGTWYHVVGRRAGAGSAATSLWISGADDSSANTAAAGVDVHADNTFQFGCRGAGGSKFSNDSIDEVNVWSRALTDGEIGDLYAGGDGIRMNTTGSFASSGTPYSTNLEGIWHLDDTPDSVAADSSAGGNNGTLYNMEIGDWVTGKVLVEGADVEVTVWSSQDGTGQNEEGIQTYGDTDGRTIIEGKTIRFNIGGVEKGQIGTDGIMSIDGLTLGIDENITLGGQTIDYETATSDFNFSDDINISDTDPHIQLKPTVGDAFELYAYGNEFYFTNVTDGNVLWRVRADNLFQMYDKYSFVNAIPTDNSILKYDAVLGYLNFEADAGGAEVNNLETICTGIATTEIFIGNAANAGVYAAMSGEASMDNLGAVTLADSVTVTGWTMGASVATTPAANDADTSLATTAFTETTQDYLKTAEWTAASTSAQGKVELAITAEIDTGTDSTRAIPTDQFVASKRNIRWLTFNLVEAATDCAVATNIAGDFVSPIAGTILQSDTTPFYLYATNSTAGVTGSMVVDISLGGTSIMTTNKLDFDTAEKTTTTAATPPDLTDTTIAVGDILTIDIDSLHTTPAKGLTVYMAIRE